MMRVSLFEGPQPFVIRYKSNGDFYRNKIMIFLLIIIIIIFGDFIFGIAAFTEKISYAELLFIIFISSKCFCFFN